MADKRPMQDHFFEQILSRINQETKSSERKLEILYRSRGDFSALQASRILYAYPIPSDRIRAIEIMQSRLASMTCSEGRDVIGAMTFPNDKIIALQCIKRALVDTQILEGPEVILSAFPFETHKRAAMNILGTVRSDIFDKLGAGGHQMYAALGSVYSQARPMDPHMYGSVEKQLLRGPGQGKVETPATYQVGVPPSIYSGHPSYAYPQGRTYASDRSMGPNVYDPTGYGTYSECPTKPTASPFYPSGAPLIMQHQGAPAPTGFQGIAQF